jgi:hypothetical protein
MTLRWGNRLEVWVKDWPIAKLLQSSSFEVPTQK